MTQTNNLLKVLLQKEICMADDVSEHSVVAFHNQSVHKKMEGQARTEEENYLIPLKPLVKVERFENERKTFGNVL